MSAAACPLCGHEHDRTQRICRPRTLDRASLLLVCACIGEERRKAAPAFTVPTDAPLVSYRQGFNDGEKYAELKAHEKANHSRKAAAPPACKNCGKPGQHFAESCPFCLESITDGHWHILNGWRCVFSMTAPPAVCAVCGGPPDNGTVGHHHPRPAPPAEAFRAEPVGFTREELTPDGRGDEVSRELSDALFMLAESQKAIDRLKVTLSEALALLKEEGNGARWWRDGWRTWRNRRDAFVVKSEAAGKGE